MCLTRGGEGNPQVLPNVPRPSAGGRSIPVVADAPISIQETADQRGDVLLGNGDPLEGQAFPRLDPDRKQPVVETCVSELCSVVAASYARSFLADAGWSGKTSQEEFDQLTVLRAKLDPLAPSDEAAVGSDQTHGVGKRIGPLESDERAMAVPASVFDGRSPNVGVAPMRGSRACDARVRRRSESL